MAICKRIASIVTSCPSCRLFMSLYLFIFRAHIKMCEFCVLVNPQVQNQDQAGYKKAYRVQGTGLQGTGYRPKKSFFTSTNSPAFCEKIIHNNTRLKGSPYWLVLWKDSVHNFKGLGSGLRWHMVLYLSYELSVVEMQNKTSPEKTSFLGNPL